jgi:hypothetical protein
MGCGPLRLVTDLSHLNAVNGTGWQAQITTGAPIGQHGMHAFVGANDGIDRAGLNAKGAAYTVLFVDDGNPQGTGLATGTINGFGLAIKQMGQFDDTFLAAWGATVDISMALGQGLGVRSAALVTALSALRLRQ